MGTGHLLGNTESRKTLPDCLPGLQTGKTVKLGKDEGTIGEHDTKQPWGSHRGQAGLPDWVVGPHASHLKLLGAACKREALEKLQGNGAMPENPALTGQEMWQMAGASSLVQGR